MLGDAPMAAMRKLRRSICEAEGRQLGAETDVHTIQPKWQILYDYDHPQPNLQLLYCTG